MPPFNTQQVSNLFYVIFVFDIWHCYEVNAKFDAWIDIVYIFPCDNREIEFLFVIELWEI